MFHPLVTTGLTPIFLLGFLNYKISSKIPSSRPRSCSSKVEILHCIDISDYCYTIYLFVQIHLRGAPWSTGWRGSVASSCLSSSSAMFRGLPSGPSRWSGKQWIFVFLVHLIYIYTTFINSSLMYYINILPSTFILPQANKTITELFLYLSCLECSFPRIPFILSCYEKDQFYFAPTNQWLVDFLGKYKIYLICSGRMVL